MKIRLEDAEALGPLVKPCASIKACVRMLRLMVSASAGIFWEGRARRHDGAVGQTFHCFVGIGAAWGNRHPGQSCGDYGRARPQKNQMTAPPFDLQDAIKGSVLSGLHLPRPLRWVDVSIDNEAVGTLAEAASLWTFTYSPEWLDSPGKFPLAPALPLQLDIIADGGSDRPAQWYFD